jgi:hypothetical protein
LPPSQSTGWLQGTAIAAQDDGRIRAAHSVVDAKYDARIVPKSPQARIVVRRIGPSVNDAHQVLARSADPLPSRRSTRRGSSRAHGSNASASISIEIDGSWLRDTS